MVLTGMANIALEVVDEQDWNRFLIALHLPLLFKRMGAHLFGDVDNDVLDRVDLPLFAYVAYMLALVIACVVMLRWRYAARNDDI